MISAATDDPLDWMQVQEQLYVAMRDADLTGLSDIDRAILELLRQDCEEGALDG